MYFFILILQRTGDVSKFVWPELGAKPPGGLTAEPHPALAMLLPDNGSHQWDSRWKRGPRKTSLWALGLSPPWEGSAGGVHPARSPLHHCHLVLLWSCYSSQILLLNYDIAWSPVTSWSLVHNPLGLGIQTSPTMGNPILTMEHYPAMKKKELPIQQHRWTSRERSQNRKTMTSTMLLMALMTGEGKQTDRVRKQTAIASNWAWGKGLTAQGPVGIRAGMALSYIWQEWQWHYCTHVLRLIELYTIKGKFYCMQIIPYKRKKAALPH